VTHRGKRRRPTLEDQINDDRQPFAVMSDLKKQRSETKTQNRMMKRKSNDEYIPENLSKKILEQARQQQAEEEEEEEEEAEQLDFSKNIQTSSGNKKRQNNPNFQTTFGDGDGDDDDEEDTNEEEEEFQELEVDEEDSKVLSMFMGKGQESKVVLSDLILEKIRQKDANLNLSPSDLESSIDPKVILVYKGVGRVMKGYTSGKVPKPFKIISSLSNWEEILYFTNPDEWSSPAMFQATRLFASNFNVRMAQRFYNIILLPRIRNEIMEHKKLNFHLYMCLKKALFKPAAFYKGFLLPLCESATCSLKEARIIGSVLVKVSVRMLDSAAALLKICSMKYSGANSLFIRILLDKKYSLPYKVIDSLVAHFMSFSTETSVLPVLWHQSLLTFVQRYKTEISKEQKEALKVLLRQQNHPRITDEIRRELFSSVCRGETSSETQLAPMVQ